MKQNVSLYFLVSDKYDERSQSSESNLQNRSEEFVRATYSKSFPFAFCGWEGDTFSWCSWCLQQGVTFFLGGFWNRVTPRDDWERHLEKEQLKPSR